MTNAERAYRIAQIAARCTDFEQFAACIQAKGIEAATDLRPTIEHMKLLGVSHRRDPESVEI